MGLAHSPSLVTDGLVLCLDAGNPKSYPGSGTVWSDLSGNGNNGTLVNGVGFSASNGGILTFDGTNQYVSLTSVPPVGQSTLSSTIEIVAYRDQTDRFEVMFGGGVESNNNDLYMGFRAADGNNFMYAYYGNDLDGATPKTNVAWNHYVAIHDNTAQARYRYFNSALLASNLPGSGVTNTSANRFFIGAFDRGSAAYFLKGRISLVRIYNRALSAAEVAQNFAAMRGRYGI